MNSDDFLAKQNYHAWSLEPCAETWVRPSAHRKDLFMHLVGWAILAPSSHNVQPWRFILRPQENIIDICVDPKGILSASDPHARQAFISVGCATEYLFLAAQFYGLSFEDQYGNGAYPSPAVRIHFRESASEKRSDDLFLRAMKERRMNRAKFDPARSVPKGFIADLRKEARTRGLVLDTIEDMATRSAIAEMQYVADRTVIAHTDFRRELASFFLPNDTGEGRGMPGNTFGLSDEMALRVHEELKKEGPFDPSLAVGFAASSRDGIRSAPLLCVLSVPSDTPEWWIKAGRAFAYSALCAQRVGLAVAVHAGLVEVEMSNKLLKARIRRFRERPTVLWRMGYATEERPHAPRRNVRDVTEIHK